MLDQVQHMNFPSLLNLHLEAEMLRKPIIMFNIGSPFAPRTVYAFCKTSVFYSTLETLFKCHSLNAFKKCHFLAFIKR